MFEEEIEGLDDDGGASKSRASPRQHFRMVSVSRAVVLVYTYGYVRK